MTDALLGRFFPRIDEFQLVPSKGGVFEVTLGDELIYSKKETGRHATVEEVVASFEARLGD